MSERAEPSPANLGSSTGRRPRRVLWKWSLTLTAAVLVFMMWQCESALNLGSESADQAAQRFHDHLNRGEFDEICREADSAFSQGEKHDEVVRFLEQVHRKLGNAGGEARQPSRQREDRRNIRNRAVCHSLRASAGNRDVHVAQRLGYFETLRIQRTIGCFPETRMLS
jgi:hypothetical protein